MVAILAGGAVACGASESGTEGRPGTLVEAESAGGDATTPTTEVPAPQPEAEGEVILVDRFDRPAGVVTDERTWHDDTGTASPDDEIWAATSGVLRSTGGEGWSDSPVFRMVTHRQDFGDVAVSLRLRAEAPAGDVDHTEEAWDGVHLLLHYQDEAELYAVSVARRDGDVAIKRKDPGGPSNGGTYSTLASGPGAMASGRWTDVRATIRRTEAGVEITVGLDGQTVLETLDTESVGDRMSQPGRVGVRADNTTFQIDDVIVQRLDPPAG